ncbi:MAG: hypothetical protein K0V04_01060 [Deltaproteobacteria bacterium]|nr:hypothetical protein [Deltaproteobacteria bacterium]
MDTGSGSTSGDRGSTTDGETAETAVDETTTSSDTDSSTGGDSGSSSGEPVGCGDGVVDLGEECDDGDGEDGNGCDNDCTESVVVGLTAGWSHTCAILDTGVVRCWGSNARGELGLGNVEAIGDDETPATRAPADIGTDAAMVAAGDAFTCAVTVDGAVRCWGWNISGQLGYGNVLDIGDDELPSSVGDNTLAAGVITTIATGTRSVCAAYDDGEVACWGDANFGQLGYGNYDNIGDNEFVSTAGLVDVPGDVVQLAVGDRHTCARLSTGAVRCWGYGGDGALGYGNPDWIGDNELPSSVGEVAVPSAVSLVAGANHTCVLTVTGLVWCWGHSANGALGHGNTAPIGDNETPVGSAMVVEDMLGESVTQIVAGADHTCALVSGSLVRCWGNGAYGRLGYGNTNDIGDDETPYSAGNVDIGGPVVQLAAGYRHTCALMQSGGVRCWGLGWDGRLGYGNTDNIGDDETPSSAGDVPLF